MVKFVSILIFILINFSAAFSQIKKATELTIAEGHMPNMTRDKNNSIHIVYGSGDSIMHISSRDGINFTSPSLVAILANLCASAMRGPQIGAAGDGLIITACTKQGNIYCYKKDMSGRWIKTKRINDENESAKEALMALSADGSNAFAIWLGVRDPKGQNVYGSESLDGGKTWSKNILVYSSPDGTVCECCKPSVSLKDNNVYVMFRNFINGNRDLYIIKSSDTGKTFGKAKKLGNGSWKLNGCPMDGGGLVIDKNGNPETVWRREDKIYADSPGNPEKEIGEGRGCSMESVDNKNIYTWSENGTVTVLKPDGVKINLGKGTLPLVKALNSHQLICVWENEKEIDGMVIEL